MTRKDFQLIADTILEQKRDIEAQATSVHPGAELKQLRETANNFAKSLSRTNPRFDSERFVTACGF